MVGISLSDISEALQSRSPTPVIVRAIKSLETVTDIAEFGQRLSHEMQEGSHLDTERAYRHIRTTLDGLNIQGDQRRLWYDAIPELETTKKYKEN